MSEPPFRRILIANRGEIALRIVRACHELGVEAVAVYSDADANARHVRAADASVRIGAAPVGESYLRADVIVEAARRSGAQAVHPGYGLLSEQPAFARACEEAGLAFIGPSPETLAALGDKLAARRLAQDAGVPIVPGTFDPLPTESPEAMPAIAAEAEVVGWPLLVKAAAGGGGRGMRRVDQASELPMAIAAAAREARAAFGDGSVYLERLIKGARHVEVQLIGDAHGTVVALGERDCSVQRRHQKLVEEAPAPGLTRERRRALHAHAVRLAGAVGLRNAATAEFLVAADGTLHFLEVNARLQVEHGVTELVSGVDLVHEQIRVAAGRPLSDEVRDASARAADPIGHAIEVRISAEDPGRDFAPLPGTITRWREPGGPGIRIDSGVESGTRVSAEYDPLLAKLMVLAPDRPRTLDRLRRAIDEFDIAGIQTTMPFHRWLVDLADFREGKLRTDLVEREWDPGPLRQAALARAVDAVARAVLAEPAVAPAPAAPRAGPEASDGWRTAARREGLERWPEVLHARPQALDR
jgi:acetyl/propionyl-CoA carboxylase alpha subunit